MAIFDLYVYLVSKNDDEKRCFLKKFAFTITPEKFESYSNNYKAFLFSMNYRKASTITQLISDSPCACKLFCHLDSQTKDCRHGERSKDLEGSVVIQGLPVHRKPFYWKNRTKRGQIYSFFQNPIFLKL